MHEHGGLRAGMRGKMTMKLTAQKHDVVRMNSACMSCILKKELERFPENISEEQRLLYKQRVLLIVGNATSATSPSEISKKIYEVQEDMFGRQIDYPRIKSFFNKKMMQYAEKTEQWIREADDPLKRAIQFSMCGNYIDFGLPDAVEEQKLDQLLRESDQIAIKEEVLCKIREELRKARSLVFLHDNCGEIVMDKLLLKEIRRQYPQLEVISVVRGKEVLNDVTVEDAEEIGLSEVAGVLSNGDDVGGTCLERISAECLDTLQKADVILAKGQGNFETLRGCGYNVFYLFLCKCELFRNRFRVPAYTGMIIHESEAVSIL